jgi:ankyrin repeat protein
VVEALLESGADAHTRCSGALRAAVEGGHHDTVDRLLQHGACDATSGPTALGAACAGGHIRFMQLLLKAGAKPDNGDVGKTGFSALTYAVFSKNRKATDLLLQHGANPEHPDQHGLTPLDRVADVRDIVINSMLRSAMIPSNPESNVPLRGKRKSSGAHELSWTAISFEPDLMLLRPHSTSQLRTRFICRCTDCET